MRPAADDAGVPDNLAVPLAPAVNVTPVGKVPVRLMVAAGYPVVAMLNVKALPAAAFAEAALENAGGCATVITSA